MKQRQPKQRSKRPRPSCEEGELRDKSIEEKMDPEFRRENLQRMIRSVTEYWSPDLLFPAGGSGARRLRQAFAFSRAPLANKP